MTVQDLLSRLEGVSGQDGQYMARCPAHDDKKSSLSIGTGQDGRVLIKCQAGCSCGAVVAALGLSERDLFPSKESNRIEATYAYRDTQGRLLAEKLRREGKRFSWRYPIPGGWEYKKPANIVPYNLPALQGSEGVYLVEGEKDVDTLTALSRVAVCSPDGAGPGKWRDSFTAWFQGKNVCIIPDNDDVGRAFAQEEAEKIRKAARSVKVLDLCRIWPELPEHGDISDLVRHMGGGAAMDALGALAAQLPEWTPEAAADADPLLSLFRPLAEFPEEEARWLVPGWIPEGQISLIAADGGVGKTTLWCHIIAALSRGTACILDPPDTQREPVKVTFLTTEDSVRKKLRRKLRLAGADMRNIITPDFVGDRSGMLHKLKFGTPEMERVLRYFRPALCIFDPVQGFTPPDVNMGSRNEMRDCMAPLISIGEDVNTTALIVCHTNKRKGACGRDRIADSADLWDIARSVMMAGYTEEEGVRYLSNEKNNYAPLQETILFTIDSNEQVHKEGTSRKRDREYMLGADMAKSTPKREECKAFIITALTEAGGTMPTKDVEEKAKAAGYSFSTIRIVKKALKDEGIIKNFQTGGNDEKVWNMQLLEALSFEPLPENTETPFEEVPRQTSQNGEERL